MSGDGVQTFDERELIVKLDIQLKNGEYIESPSDMQFSTKKEMIQTGQSRYDSTCSTEDDTDEASMTSSMQRVLAKSPIARVLEQKKRDERESKKRMALLKETFEFMAYLQQKYDLTPASPGLTSRGSIALSKQLGRMPYADVVGWSAISPSSALQASKMEDDHGNRSKSSSLASSPASGAVSYSRSSCSTTTVPSCSSIVYEPQRPGSFKEVYRGTIRPQPSASLDSLASSGTSSAMSWSSDSQKFTNRVPRSLSSTGESRTGSSSVLDTGTSQYLSLPSATTDGLVKIPIGTASSRSLNRQRRQLASGRSSGSILLGASDSTSYGSSSLDSSRSHVPGVYPFNFKKRSSQSSMSAPMTTSTSKSYPKVVYNYDSDNSAERKSALSGFSRSSNELEISEAKKMYEMVPCSVHSNLNLGKTVTQTTQTESRSSTFPVAKGYMLVSGATPSFPSPATKSKSSEFKAMMDMAVKSNSQTSLDSSASSSTVFRKAKMTMPKSCSRAPSSTDSITESISMAKTKDETPSDHSIEEVTQKTQSDSNKSTNEKSSPVPPTARSLTESKSTSGVSEVGVDALAVFPTSLTVFADRPTTLGLHNKCGEQMQITIEAPDALTVTPSDLALSGHRKAHIFISTKSAQNDDHTLKVCFKTANAAEKSVIDVQVQVVGGSSLLVPQSK